MPHEWSADFEFISMGYQDPAGFVLVSKYKKH